MVMKTYFKSVLRSVKSNIARFISIIVIMLLGIAFVAGLGTVSPTFKDSFSDQMNKDRFADITIKCKLTSGFSPEAVALVENSPLVEEISTLSAVDLKEGATRTRLYVYDDLKTQVNKLSIQGRLPENANEVLVERESNAIGRYALNDKITLFGMPIEYTVVGIVSNPQIFDLDGEPFINSATQEADGELNKIVYMDRAHSIMDFFPTTDLQLRLKGLGTRAYFSEDYLQQVDEAVETLKTLLGEEDYAFLTVEENKSCALLDSYCDKVAVITLIFPVFFIAVAALVVMTTVTRMAEEDRSILGCLKSLGVGDGKILFKYLLLTSICCFISSLVGMLGGLVLPNVIYPAFATLFFLPPMSPNFYPLSGVLALLFMTAAVLLVTVAVCRSSLKEKPAELLTAKAPKAGKTILLERVTFLWKRLSFKYKSSIRNVFRYKKHLIMTILSVAGSTALVFAGLALLNVSDAMAEKGGSYAKMTGSISMIAAVVIVFALLLCVFVIYNLTNLNVGERKREIATLSVLGYHGEETMGYIYREIMMMAAVGAVIGIGLGMALIYYVLECLEFGSLWDAKWYAYVLSFVLVILFVALTDLLLARKILNIDMTASLKSND